MFKLLYNNYPRQVGFPFRVNCRNELEFKRYIKQANGSKRIFASVYNYHTLGDKPYENINLSRVFFDFDNETAYTSVIRCVRYLLDNDLRFIVCFSGAGYHVYLFTTNYSHLKDIKQTLTNIHNHFSNMLDLDLDEAVVGDICRLAGIPNTFNTKRGKFVIPLTIEDLERGEEYIKELANHQVFKLKVYGTKLLDASTFDRPSTSNTIKDSVYEDVALDDIICIDGAPPCISMMLTNGDKIEVGWKNRFLIIVYYKDRGYAKNQVEELLIKYLTNPYNGTTEGLHCIKNKHQVEELFKQSKYVFPSCESIKKNNGCCKYKGFCNQTKQWGNEHKVRGLYK